MLSCGREIISMEADDAMKQFVTDSCSHLCNNEYYDCGQHYFQ